MMPWSVRILPEFPIVETKYSGILTPAELTDAVRETMALTQTHGTSLLLGDCLGLEGGHSIVDLYELSDFLGSTGMAQSMKEAVLLPGLPMAAEDVRFWETACLNRGIRVQVFLDRQNAIDWLLQ
jgi:hypothetical protein